VTDLEICLLINDGNLQESDILYNNGYTWESSLNPFFFSGSYNVALVGAHEMGHGLGLDHENGRLATMNSNYPDGGVLGNNHAVQIHSDDSLGSRVGYGTCCTRRDVAASVYEKTSGGNSRHIPSPTQAERGHSTSFRFTLENRGTTSESSVRTNFYLSTDRFISTGDAFLGSATFSLGSGAVSTLSAGVTIPLSVASGFYYLGVLADPNNSIGEVDESNNGAGLAGPVFVPSTSHPFACFTASTTSGPEPLRVSFNASCSSDPDGSIVSYSWDFNDGSFGSGSTTSHVFDAGTYQVRLTVRDNDGLTDQFSVILVVTGSSGCIICNPV
jgi:PKD repeat protein